MPTRSLVLAAAAVAVAGWAPTRATAHDLQLKVQVFPDKVRILAGFDDDSPAEGARVTVTDGNGNVVAEAKADERGVCDLPKPPPGKYAVVVESLGHRDMVKFEVEPALEAVSEYAGWRPDKLLGVGLGVGGLLAGSVGFWWLRKRKAAPPNEPPVW